MSSSWAFLVAFCVSVLAHAAFGWWVQTRPERSTPPKYDVRLAMVTFDAQASIPNRPEKIEPVREIERPPEKRKETAAPEAILKLPAEIPPPPEELPTLPKEVQSKVQPEELPPPKPEAMEEPLPEPKAKEPPVDLPKLPPMKVEAPTPESAESRASVGAKVDLLPEKHSTNLPPVYPEEARTAGQEGRVVLRVRVDADGKVEAIRVHQSSGVPSLDEAALKAVRLWTFTPGKSNGKSVAADVAVPVSFSLNRP